MREIKFRAYGQEGNPKVSEIETVLIPHLNACHTGREIKGIAEQIAKLHGTKNPQPQVMMDEDMHLQVVMPPKPVSEAKQLTVKDVCELPKKENFIISGQSEEYKEGFFDGVAEASGRTVNIPQCVGVDENKLIDLVQGLLKEYARCNLLTHIKDVGTIVLDEDKITIYDDYLE